MQTETIKYVEQNDNSYKFRLGAEQGSQHDGIPPARPAHLQPGPARLLVEEEGADRPRHPSGRDQSDRIFN